MKYFFSYWFWPNPGGWHYEDPKVMALLVGCVLLVLASFVLRYWRRNVRNPMTRTLSSSWPTVVLVFGFIALVLTISRVETIQFMSMRAVWAVWSLSFVATIVFQVVKFRRKHYVIIQRDRVVDARDRYLPKKKKY